MDGPLGHSALQASGTKTRSVVLDVQQAIQSILAPTIQPVTA